MVNTCSSILFRIMLTYAAVAAGVRLFIGGTPKTATAVLRACIPQILRPLIVLLILFSFACVCSYGEESLLDQTSDNRGDCARYVITHLFYPVSAKLRLHCGLDRLEVLTPDKDHRIVDGSPSRDMASPATTSN